MSEQEVRLLNDYQHCRLRTEMYLGSRTESEFVFPIVDTETSEIVYKPVKITPSVLTAFREALDNALDELSFRGRGVIHVTFDEEDMVFRIEDNGRGIPFDFREDVGMHTATLAVSHTKAGRNFGERGEQAGTNGLGISVVNFCSMFFELEVLRNRQRFYQTFREGDEDLIVEEPEILEATDTDHHAGGTIVRFRLSPKVFKEGMSLSEEVVRSIVYIIAKTNPQYTVLYNNETDKITKNIRKNLFGNRPVIEMNFNEENVCNGQFFITMTNSDSNFFSFVNNVPAYNGGTHMDEFKYHFPRQLMEALKKESKKRRLNPNKNDILEGINVLNVMKMKAPNFDSQSKTRLTNSEVKKPIAKMLCEETHWEKFIADNKGFIDAIYARCAARTGKKDSSQIDENAKALKKVKIPKLVDATSKDRSNCVLFLTEGDSAAGGVNNVRNPEIHAVMPLRGKIRNVHGAHPKDVITSKASIIKDICAAIGLVPGKPVDPEQLRFSRVYIMADADEDGQGSICPLIVNFFYQFWPELFNREEAFIHLFLTPLIILRKGNERKYFYPSNMDDFDPKKFASWKVTRAKGLASMSIDNFRDHIDDPLSVPVIEDSVGSIKKLLSLLFADRANDRKTMLEISVEEILELFQTQGFSWTEPTTNTLDL